MLYVLYAFLLSYSLGNSSPCSGKVDLSLKLQKDTIYTYTNSISITKWPKRNEPAAKQQSNNFTSMLYPVGKTPSGFKAYELISKSQNNDLLDLITKPPIKLPDVVNYPFYPIGLLEGASGNNPVPLKNIDCDKVFRVAENTTSANGDLTFSKTSINKIAGTEERSFKDKDIDLIRLESRADVELQGKMEGTGSEKITTYLIADTREPFEEIRSFKYEYVTGEGDNRVAEVISGEYKKRLIRKDKYKKPAPVFSGATSKDNIVSYYTNSNGVFIPVTLGNTVATKMYISPTSPSSFLDYTFYVQNFSNKPKNYFYPVEKLDVGGNLILNPGIEIIKKKSTKIDYKIPGLIGKSVISKSVIILNDKKRTFVMFEASKVKKPTPYKALLIDVVDEYPIFELTVNGTLAKTTISFDSTEPEISQRLTKQLRLKTIHIAGSEDKPEENSIEKAEIIITPTDRPYFKTQAIVKDFGDAPFDLKLGLDYIKGKELIINYKRSWLLIKDVK